MSLLNITKDQLRATIRSIWQGERPDADDTRYSDLWLYSRVASVVVWRMLQTIDRGVNAIFPTTSFGVYLENWLNWIGAPDGTGNGTFGRIVARGSTGTDAISVTSTGATVDIQDYELTDDSVGKTYKINESYAFVGVDTVSLDIAAVDTGAATNLESGAGMTFSSPPANIVAAATLVKDLDGGADRETDPEGRARLLNLLRDPPASGNVSDWVSTVKAVSPGNFDVFVWPQRQSYPYGYGMTDYCALQKLESGSDRFILAADDIYTDIDTAIDDNLPALLYRNSRQLTMVEDAIEFAIQFELFDGATSDQKCDWDSTTVILAVASHDAGGNTIVADGNIRSPDRTNGALVGDKIVIDGVETTIASFNSATSFEVDYWPYPTGANVLDTMLISAGGGLVGHIDQTDANGNDYAAEGVCGTVQAYADSIGPTKGDYAASGEISAWDDTARVQAIQSDVIADNDGAIIDVAVKLDGVVDTDYSPTDATASGATVNVITVDELIVWQTYV